MRVSIGPFDFASSLKSPTKIHVLHCNVISFTSDLRDCKNPERFNVCGR